jgi:hypothetical protein
MHFDLARRIGARALVKPAGSADEGDLMVVTLSTQAAQSMADAFQDLAAVDERAVDAAVVVFVDVRDR